MVTNELCLAICGVVFLFGIAVGIVINEIAANIRAEKFLQRMLTDSKAQKCLGDDE